MESSARIGTTLRGKWRIDRLLGTGGFASVYAATHRAGKRVAIKVLHPALSSSADVRRRFLKEAYAANAVEHPGVVGVSDDDVTEDGAAFLVMDLLDGETVEARRKSAGGRLDVSLVLQIVDDVLDVLAAAHDKGIVHRDLKAENLFLTTTNQVKILDFGIARFREPGDEGTATQTGLTMGSPAFMAPEQARGRWSEVDVRTDVYALGATMFTLLSGQLVHGKGNMNETLIAAATRAAPPLASVAPHVPAAVALVVDRAVAFEKAARWPDARAMRAAVRAAREALTGAVSTLPLSVVQLTGTAPTLATLPVTPAASPSGPSGGPVTTSSPIVSAPVAPPTAAPSARVVPAPAARSKSGLLPIAVAILAVAALAAGVTLWWVTHRPAVAGGSEPASVPLPPISADATDPIAPAPPASAPVVEAPSPPAPPAEAPASPPTASAAQAAAEKPAPAASTAAAGAPAGPKSTAGTTAPAAKPPAKQAPVTTKTAKDSLLGKRK